VYRNSWLDNIVMVGALTGVSMPIFWLGLILMLIFSVWLGWFPVSGARSASALVLPVLTIGLGGTALVARITRVAMIEASGRDFVTLLHAKGLSPLRIQLRHVLRHVLIPVVTILALRIGWILGGAVTVEVVFARPGLGTLLIKSLSQHDYPVVQACLLMLAMAVMLGTLLGDILQAAMDPRVRAALA
ncbi:MAG: ABC transporter permease, partial [Cypionkella sp.]